MDFSVLVVALDLGTAICGLVNAGYFARYWWRRNGSRARRMGAAALTLVSAATVVEALFSQSLFWPDRGSSMDGQTSAALWALARLPLLLATLFISAIIARRESARRWQR
ncbi:MAG: hypothetical protein IIC89_05090 [Chloroflexi bacterium]|nr:hypothetical protein [Chloroflexota bacterium]